MGCWYSRLEREEMVSRCKARKRYMKQLVKARHAFAAAHSMYIRSLRNTGSALLQFATAETSLHHHHLPPSNPPPPPPLPSNPPPPFSPMSWTTTSTTPSSAIRPPPPPPPAPSASTWDFWDPFMPTSRRPESEEWETTTATVSEATVTHTTTVASQNVAAPPSVITATTTNTTTNTTASSELAVVVSTKGKDLVEIIRELDDYFLQAANAGGPLSALLEVPVCNFNRQSSLGKDNGYGKSLTPLLWSWGSGSAKWNAFGKFCEDPIGNAAQVAANGNATHCSTVERLYAWEKKLFQEVKNAEYLKSEHEKRVAALRKLEMKNAEYIKSEKAKKEVEKLESQMMVAVQAIETTSIEIVKLRESELHPQLLQLVKGLMSMWRSMYEFHQVQTHIVQQLKYLNCIPSTYPTTEIHRQSTLQLELEAQQWHLSFCSLIKAQREYIQSLTGWLRLSLFQVGNNPISKSKHGSIMYSFCEEWQLAMNNAPDNVASEGIKSFLTVIHAIVVQQAEEQKEKRKSESVFKELEKKAGELRSLESKHGPSYAMPETSGDTSKDPVREKRAKVEALRSKAEDEKAKYEKSISVTRAMTMNNLQMGLPHVFQAMTGFANVCTQAFESVINQSKSTNDLHNVKL
ncbi:protein ALTERED PHOSPHATE STARVATION RESPONSE 1-like [Salvia splendens]|nr:protein ALTERED PHOSPHATE STARVATION RESPONSE 1-like [Salvia splendens]